MDPCKETKFKIVVRSRTTSELIELLSKHHPDSKVSPGELNHYGKQVKCLVIEEPNEEYYIIEIEHREEEP
jgi:hypothetical protein